MYNVTNDTASLYDECDYEEECTLSDGEKFRLNTSLTSFRSTFSHEEKNALLLFRNIDKVPTLNSVVTTLNRNDVCFSDDRIFKVYNKVKTAFHQMKKTSAESTFTQLSTTRGSEDIRATYKASLLRFRGIKWDTETREAIQCFVDVDLKKPLSFKEVNVVLEINGFELPHNTILRIFRKVRRAMVGIGCVSRDGCITNQITESIPPEQAAIRRKKFKASLSSFRNCSGRTWSADAMESLKCFYDVDPKRTPSMQDILVVLDSFGFKFDRPANFRIYNKIKAAMKYLRKSV